MRVFGVDLPVMPPIRPMLAKSTSLEEALALLPDVGPSLPVDDLHEPDEATVAVA